MPKFDQWLLRHEEAADQDVKKELAKEQKEAEETAHLLNQLQLILWELSGAFNKWQWNQDKENWVMYKESCMDKLFYLDHVLDESPDMEKLMQEGTELKQRILACE